MNGRATTAPPSTPPPPPPPPRTPPPPPPPTSSTSPRRAAQRGWTIPQLSAPAWLAAAGAVLVLVAAVIVVASGWQTITPEVRFAGLVAALVAVYFAAESGRIRIPLTAAALAVLAATITAPVGIAAAATIGQPWPICTIVGGVVALVACEVQARRWAVPTLKAATVVAFALAATGVAGLTDAPVGLLAAAGAVAALALGARRRSIALACAVGLSPWLVLLADAGLGPGTLERIGATGAALAWSAPVAAAIAACVVAVTAIQRNVAPLAVMAVAILASGLLTGLGIGAAPAALWLSTPATTLLLIEALAATDRSVFGRLARRAAPVLAGALAAIAVALPLSVFAASVAEGTHRFVVPAGLTAVSLVAAWLGTVRTCDRRLGDLVVAGVVGASLTIVGLLDVQPLWMATAALATWPLTMIATAGRRPLVLAAVHLVWYVAAALSDPTATNDQFAALVTAAATLLVVAFARSRSEAWPVGVPVTVITAAGIVAALLPRDLDLITAVLAAVSVVGTGVALRTATFDVVDALAMSAGIAAVVVALGAGPAATSLALAVVCVEGVLYSQSYGRRDAAVGFGIGAAGSFLSLWWTTGTNERAIAWLAPYGVTGQDLALGAASVGLLAAGAVLRSRTSTSTWLAYGPGLGMAITWLLASQTEAHGDWAAFGALFLGIAALASGGVARLAAPLVAGTIAIAGTLVISAGPRLAAAPIWSWIAVGGTGLLVLAALIERSDRPILPIGKDRNSESVVESFFADFE